VTIDVTVGPFDLGEITLPTVELDRGSVPRLSVESFSRVVGVEFQGTRTVEVPTGEPPRVDVDFTGLLEAGLPDSLAGLTSTPVDTLRQALTDATELPADLFTQPAAYVFETAFAELESRVTEATARRIRELANGFLEVVLSEGTKQDLRSTREEG
jgi:hypothetical protein